MGYILKFYILKLSQEMLILLVQGEHLVKQSVVDSHGFQENPMP